MVNISKPHAKCFPHFILHNPHHLLWKWYGTIHTLTFQMRKPRQREVQWLSQIKEPVSDRTEILSQVALRLLPFHPPPTLPPWMAKLVLLE